MPQHGLHHVDEACDIDVVVGKWLRHRLPDIGKRGEMDDGARTMLRERRIQCGNIENVTLHEGAPAHELCVPFGEVVECERQEPRLGERLAGVAADKACTASDENGFHAARGRRSVMSSRTQAVLRSASMMPSMAALRLAA